jgi:DNA polymerase-3 subunit epsilon
MNFLDQTLNDITLVAFDTETTGAYPLGFEVVEFGAVKWHQGKIVGELQILLKPSKPMSEEVIKIHGITNEMVVDCPPLHEKVGEIRAFMDGAILMAHHAPFDMGFMSVCFEGHSLPFPHDPVLCTSLLSRRWIAESANHRLQTLVAYLKINGGQAHRALDDARACLEVGLECWRRAGADKTLAFMMESQGKHLKWADYSLLKNENNLIRSIAEAIHGSKDMDILYDGGSLRNTSRRITPVGIVRNPDGDYVSAICHLDRAQKRFYLGKIKDFTIVY